MLLIILVLIALIININFIFNPAQTSDNKSKNLEYAENNTNNSGIFSYLLRELGLKKTDSSREKAGNNGSAGSTENSSASDNLTSNASTIEDRCFASYNLTAKTIIFYYQDELHSNNMKPIVMELESAYKFYWTSDVWNEGFNSCFGHSTGAVPTFVCAGTKQKIIGEISKSQLEAFALSC